MKLELWRDGALVARVEVPDRPANEPPYGAAVYEGEVYVRRPGGRDYELFWAPHVRTSAAEQATLRKAAEEKAR